MTPYLSLLLFICVMVATPGPANLLIMMGGARYGVRKCLPFVGGLIVGKVLLNLTIGMGLGSLLLQYPGWSLTMKLLSGGFIIWIALSSWGGTGTQEFKSSRFSFISGMIVHPLNPKAWAMVTLAWSSFGPGLGSINEQAVIIPMSFACVQVVFHTMWAGLGSALGKQFKHSLYVSRVLIIATVGIVIASLFIL